MSSTYIGLLKKRITGLGADDYELEAWKKGTTLLLTRIFGEGNAYSKEVDGLKVDYSSWNLRDATSDYNPKASCKQQGKEILELAIAELELPVESKKLSDVNELLKDKSDQLAEALANKDAALALKLLMKENKEQLAHLVIKLLS